MELQVTEDYLNANPTHIFVFGDNLYRYGNGGAAKLRHLPNTYGFITKKAPTYNDDDLYKPDEYASVFEEEFEKLIKFILENPDKIFLISKIGAGLANRHNIYEEVIQDRLPELTTFPNVILLTW